MPKSITQYTVFIASPGGLKAERKRFRETLEQFSQNLWGNKDVRFHPVGCENTLSGMGRAQALINKNLEQCDYAVFVLHDRWGSPTGNGHTSGTQEEWELANDLFKQNKVSNIALFFKKVNKGHLKAQSDQISQVHAFRKKIETEYSCLFKEYRTTTEFVSLLNSHLMDWQHKHDMVSKGLPYPSPDSAKPPFTTPTVAQDFSFWVSEIIRNSEDENTNHQVTLYLASKAVYSAKSDIEWAWAKYSWGNSQYQLGRIDEAIAAITEIADRLSTSIDPNSREWHANALLNKGTTLGHLGRGHEAIAVYDDLVARFGTADEPALRKLVSAALINKGNTLADLSEYDHAIEIYDAVINRLGKSKEPPMQEFVASALVNKASALISLGDYGGAIVSCDALLNLAGNKNEPISIEIITSALNNKAISLQKLGRMD